MKSIGIIAGNGLLPLRVAAAIREEGHSVFSCCIEGETDPSLPSISDSHTWVKLGELKKTYNYFEQHGVDEAVFIGKITKTSIFAGHIKPDVDMVFLFSTLPNRNDDTILAGICDYFEKKGVHIIDSTTYLKSCMPPLGCLTKKKPSKKEKEDIQFGWVLAKESARLDIGQSVVVKDKTILAVEAIEGTDQAIARGGLLGGENGIVIKVEKPQQDMRFDVPTIGKGTIHAMRDAKMKVLAFEANKTLFVDMDEVIKEANDNNIIIVGWE